MMSFGIFDLFDFTSVYFWFALAGMILPTALYVVCVLVGPSQKVERPYFAPTTILLAMIVSVVLAHFSTGSREHVVSYVDSGGEGWLVFSWHVELLASAGLLALIFLRKARRHGAKVQFALTDLVCCVATIGALMGIQFGMIHEWSPPFSVLVLWAILIPLLAMVGCSSKGKWAYPLVCLTAIALRPLVPFVVDQSWEHAAFVAACILCICRTITGDGTVRARVKRIPVAPAVFD